MTMAYSICDNLKGNQMNARKIVVEGIKNKLVIFILNSVNLNLLINTCSIHYTLKAWLKCFENQE